MRTVYFERLLEDPESVVLEVCEFLGLEYEESMLAVPKIGSSNVPDRPAEEGIDSNRASSWKSGGLSNTELFLTEKVVDSELSDQGYESARPSRSLLSTVAALLTLPVKLGLALLVNMSRTRNLLDSIKRRLP